MMPLRAQVTTRTSTALGSTPRMWGPCSEELPMRSSPTGFTFRYIYTHKWSCTTCLTPAQTFSHLLASPLKRRFSFFGSLRRKGLPSLFFETCTEASLPLGIMVAVASFPYFSYMTPILGGLPRSFVVGGGEWHASDTSLRTTPSRRCGRQQGQRVWALQIDGL